LSDTPASPRASRLASPRWLDGRLVLGVLLVLVSVVVGARVLSAADRSTAVYAVTRDLAAGSVLGSDDLEQVRVRLFDNAEQYVAAGTPPLGYVLRRGLGAGELLPRRALSRPADDVDFREVTVPVEVGHLPPGLGHGTQVDVWITPEPSAAQASASADEDPTPTTASELELRGAQLVLQGVTVLAVQSEGGGFSGSTSVPVVLQVRPTDVSALVSAMSLGRIDLVRVPRPVEGGGRLEPAAGSG
jgi:Flp pilus assembly protein CpaB